MTDDDQATGGARPGALERLLALQDEDVHGDQLTHRLAHLAEQAALDDVDRRLAGLAAALRPLEARRAELDAKVAELERETREVESRVAAIEERARSGAASSFRDQEAMSTEIASLGHRRDELEDRELELLEEAEPVDAELAALEAGRGPLLAEREAASAARDVAAASTEDDLALSRARRAELAADVPDALLAEYERLRAKLGGVGAARLVRGTCSGCHLTLPATEVDRLRRAPEGTVEHCEQCGRILVP